VATSSTTITSFGSADAKRFSPFKSLGALFRSYRFDGQALDYFGEFRTLDAAKAATVKQISSRKIGEMK